MKTILILGGGGFIGGHLAKRLKKEGNWVRIVDIKKHEYFEEKDICDEFVIGDLRDPSLVSVIMYGPEQHSTSDNVNSFDEVYQLAADMGGAGYIFTGEHDSDVMHNSALINLNVAKEAVAKNVKKLFYSSSACMYPEHNQLDPENPNCEESSAYPANPDSEYGWEKLFSERLYMAYHRNNGLNIRIARFHNIFGPCFDDKTEVLTNDGWKYFKDTDNNDEFATLSDTNKLVYLKPVKKQAYMYKGDMYKTSSKSVDQLVTPDHKIYVSSNTTINNKTVKNNFALRQAKNLKWDINRLYYTSNFEWDGMCENTHYFLPKTYMADGRNLHNIKCVDMFDWFEFIGWFVSEGCKFKTPTNYTVVITQYEKTNHFNREEIKNLLKRMGINFSEDKNQKHIIINDKQLYNTLENEGIINGAKNKSIPKWMLKYSKEYLTILYNSMMKGDGNKSNRRYNTTSPILKDQFMEIALKLGKVVTASETEKRKKDNHSKIYRIYISERKYMCTKRESRSIVQYNGMVYDVTLPSYHLLLVRRNGKVCWSGNCGTWRGGKEKAPAAMCRKAAETPDGNVLEVWGDGKQTRSFLYIDECVEAILRLMNSSFMGPVNIGSEEMVTINELARMAIILSRKNIVIQNIYGDEFLVKYGHKCPIGVKGRNSDNKLYKEKIGWTVSEPLFNGLMETYEWIEEQIKK